MSLRAVNLNLLPVLRALLNEASVTRAAAELGLTQSAVSDALGRLRDTLNDPLLVRVGGKMALTARATELIAPTQHLCAELEAFFVQRGFDPKLAKRQFVIATADYGTLVVAKAWLSRLATQAPDVTLRFASIDRLLPARLADRSLDFAIVPSPFIADLGPGPIATAPLAIDRPVALFRKGHALDRDKALSAGELRRYRLLGFDPGVGEIVRRHGDFFSGGMHFDAVVTVPQITLMPYLLLESDEVAVVPQGLASRMVAILPLASVALDFATNAHSLSLIWSAVQEADPGHRWFRNEIAPLIVDPC